LTVKIYSNDGIMKPITLPAPEDIEKVPSDQIPALLSQLAAVQGMLAARLLTDTGNGNRQPEDDELVNLKEAATMLKVSESWIYHRSKKLPFIVRLGRQIKYSKKGIQNFIKNRKEQ
jgi:predicted DNA-binding transcriptional regulator AlpA